MSDDSFGLWARQFLANFEDAAATPTGEYPGLSRDAAALLRSVDANGVPAFISHALRQIAAEHGIAVDGRTTPNAIIDALRAISRGAAATGS